ncbi:hypothetical protein JL720_826 [Aureococcus anophagefferens]|nr:hypothetical protein JL720_826 [Aureococcus anophagefferens]
MMSGRHEAGRFLTVYVIAAVQKGIDVDQATWLSVVKDGCAGSRTRGRCRTCSARAVRHRACPALYKRPDPTPRGTVSTAFWNARSKRTKGGGDVEVHLINDKETMDCGPTEKASLAARFKDPSVRRIKPGEEKLVSVGVVANAQVAPPTLRVKPLGAPCGDGVDVEVDFANRGGSEVTTNAAEESPRSPANLPLLVRLMDDRDARDALPKDHPAAKGEL